MGQRSQIFLKCHNPFLSMQKELKAKRKSEIRDSFDEHIEKLSEVERALKIFGSGETIILAYHHQWLYGRSMALVVTKLLEFNKMADEYQNFFNKEFYKNSYRECVHTPKEFLDSIQSLIGMFNDPLCEYARAGRERFTLLNNENGEDDTFDDIIDNFTNFDNNDGVMIVDMTKGKYAIVNIYKQEKGCQSIRNLPKMYPVGIAELVKSYYGEELVKEDDEHSPVGEKEVRENKRINKKFISRAKRFKVLTPDELKAIFPIENIVGAEEQLEKTIV